MSQSNVKNLVKGFWKDAALQQILPQTVFVSIPVPMMVYGTPCIGQFAYTMKGEAFKPKQISAPVFQVVRRASNGRVLSACFAPFFTPCAKPQDAPAGVYPGPALQGKTLQECDELYDKYYELCDLMLDQMQQTAFKQCAAYAEWETFFHLVAEDGFQPYFEEFFKMNERFGIPAENLPKAEAKEENRPVIRPSQSQPKQVQSVNLPRFFRILNEAASESQNQQILELSKELQGRTDRQDFRVAVIGEFSRGKSHFLNELLETEILPEGTLPTTGVLTQIRNASVSSLVHILPNRQSVTEPLTQEACKKYTLQDDGSSPEGVLKLQFPILWLQGVSISFYDTPGVGDLIDGRHLLATKTIYNSDAAILVISANAPCSMTEMEFLRENIVLKGIPNVAVVITHLDKISPKEMRPMIQYIEQRVHDVLPSAQLWTLNAQNVPQETILDAVGTASIREKIIQWSQASELVELRKRQTAYRILELAETLNEGVATRLESAQKSDEEKRKQYEKVLQTIQTRSLMWEQLELEANAHCLETRDWASKELEQCRERLEEDLQISLKKAANPYKWLQEDMTYQIRRTMESLSIRIENGVQKQLGMFRMALEQNIQKHFSSTLEKTVNVYTLEEMPEMQMSCDVTNLDKTKMIYRIASAASVSLTMLFIAVPMGALISAAGIWLSEKHLSEKIEAQRQIIIPKLGVEIQKLFTEWDKKVDFFILEQYKALVQEIKTKADLWLKTQKDSAAQSLKEKLQGSTIHELQDIDQKIKLLISEIREKIK